MGTGTLTTTQFNGRRAAATSGWNDRWAKGAATIIVPLEVQHEITQKANGVCSADIVCVLGGGSLVQHVTVNGPGGMQFLTSTFRSPPHGEIPVSESSAGCNI